MSAKTELLRRVRDAIADVRSDEFPGFEQVHLHEPKQVAYARSAWIWYGGEQEQGMTLGQVLREESFPLRCYWRETDGTHEELERIELELVAAHAAIKAALWGEVEQRGDDPSLTLLPGLAETGYEEMQVGPDLVQVFRVLRIPLTLQDLEGEEIAR